MICRCLEDKAPTYLSDYCIPVTAVSSRHLHSVNQHQLTVPRCRRITFGHRAFSVAGPMVWNSLPTEFRNLSVSFDVFRRTVKTILFARYYCIQRNRECPMVWNSLPTEFRNLSVSFDVFRRTVKTILFARYYCIQRNRDVS